MTIAAKSLLLIAVLGLAACLGQADQRRDLQAPEAEAAIFLEAAGDLLETAGRRVEIRLSGASQALKDSLGSRGTIVDDGAGHVTLRVEGQKTVEEVIRISNAAGARLDAMIPERQTLEKLFLQDTGR